MVIPYRLKHVPSGLYYQPHKYRGSNLSKKGKVYMTKGNILSIAYFSNGDTRKTLTIFADKDSKILKEFRDSFDWVESTSYNQMKAETLATDWINEELNFK